jgi:hypothetical protein
VIERALDRDPERRFPTCLALAEAIEGAIAGSLTLASGREVAATVDLLIGARLASRREAVNGWLAGSVSQASATGTWAALSPSMVGLPPSSSKIGALPPPTPPPRRPDGLSSGGYPISPSSSPGVPVPPAVFNPVTGRSLVGGLEVGVARPQAVGSGPIGAGPSGEAGQPTRSRARLAVVVLPVLAVLVLLFAWRSTQDPSRNAPAGVTASGALPAASPVLVASVGPAASAVEAPSASAAPLASALVVPAAVSGKAAGKLLKGGKPGGRDDIDDTVKNPYRR